MTKIGLPSPCLDRQFVYVWQLGLKGKTIAFMALTASLLATSERHKQPLARSCDGAKGFAQVRSSQQEYSYVAVHPRTYREGCRVG